MKFPVSKEAILVFSNDGVIFHSDQVRVDVYEELFSDHPRHRQAIHKYNIKSVGLPARMKFMHICGNILKLDDVEEKVNHYLGLMDMYLNLKLKQAPLVDGVREFIQRHQENIKFICSDSKIEEIEEQLRYNNLRQDFKEVYGRPHEKRDILFSIKGRFEQEIVFFGDSVKDWKAAQEASVQFIGIDASKYNHPLRSKPIHIVGSFHELV